VPTVDGKIFIGCDQTIRFDKVKDEDGNYLNSGTATWELTDSEEVPVASGALDYIPASNGSYRAVIQSDVTGALALGTIYFLKMVFSSGDWNDTRRQTLVAAYKR
jgi:hypothetical protein